jgi:hypothetical protein
MAPFALPMNAMTVPRLSNVIAEQRDRIIEIGVYCLPVFIGAILPMLPLLVSSSWRSILVSVEGIT